MPKSNDEYFELMDHVIGELKYNIVNSSGDAHDAIVYTLDYEFDPKAERVADAVILKLMEKLGVEYDGFDRDGIPTDVLYPLSEITTNTLNNYPVTIQESFNQRFTKECRKPEEIQYVPENNDFFKNYFYMEAIYNNHEYFKLSPASALDVFLRWMERPWSWIVLILIIMQFCLMLDKGW